jgi:hypothetical protein
MLGRLQELDQRQWAIAWELASLHRRSNARASSEQFGPMLTGLVAAMTLGVKSGDWYSPALVNGLPALQVLLASRGRVVADGLGARPASTLGFALAALVLGAFGDKLFGVGGRPSAPDVEILPGGRREVLVVPRRSDRPEYRYSVARGRRWPRRPPKAPPPDPTTNGTVMRGPVRLKVGDQIKIVAVATGGTSAVLEFTA